MTAPAVRSGPRRLTLMPADLQAALDPYMAMIVGYRKSGLSLNHIIGCPLDCGYCVRHFWGNWEVKVPQRSPPLTWPRWKPSGAFGSVCCSLIPGSETRVLSRSPGATSP